MSDEMERREYPRAKADLSLKIETGAVIESKVRNISCSGIHCQIKCPVQLMSKVVIALLLPSLAGKKSGNFDKIDCEGVVVRIQKVAERDEILYNTAVFFTNLDKKDKEKIAHFVEHKLFEQER